MNRLNGNRFILVLFGLFRFFSGFPNFKKKFSKKFYFLLNITKMGPKWTPQITEINRNEPEKTEKNGLFRGFPVFSGLFRFKRFIPVHTGSFRVLGTTINRNDFYSEYSNRKKPKSKIFFLHSLPQDLNIMVAYPENYIPSKFISVTRTEKNRNELYFG